MNTLVFGTILVAVICTVWSAQSEGHGSSYDVQGTQFDLGKLVRRTSDEEHRTKRACTWTFDWRVNGANVNTEYITKLLNDFFRNVCAKYS